MKQFIWLLLRAIGNLSTV